MDVNDKVMLLLFSSGRQRGRTRVGPGVKTLELGRVLLLQVLSLLLMLLGVDVAGRTASFQHDLFDGRPLSQVAVGKHSMLLLLLLLLLLMSLNSTLRQFSRQGVSHQK